MGTNIDGMDRLGRVVILACVCVLLVLVSGGVESGKVTGFDYGGISVGVLFKWLGGTRPFSTNSSTAVNPSGNATSEKGKTSVSGQPKPTSGLDFAVFLPSFPAWPLAALVIAFFAGASLFILKLKPRMNVVDLEGTLSEMEKERKSVEETWSYRLRNAALLRYYLLMRRACLRVGLRDDPAETPQEYVQRVSAFFRVDKFQAAQFASAVNRSRYGLELSDAEANEASKFMGIFVDLIRRRANAPN